MSRTSSSKPYLVFSTIDSQTKAKKLAKVLVQKKLAVCVNIVPHVISSFRWKGKVDHAREHLLVIKTEARYLKRLEQTLKKLHSYEVPEIIGFPIQWGSKSYLGWLQDSLS